jgi:MSHA pilin protein MshD
MCIEIHPLNRMPALSRSQAGLSLVELIMFIIIVSVGVAGILTVFNLTSQKSADPQVRRQMLAVAEALLEEVEFKPFTLCDPDDPNAATAVTSANCTGGAGGANDESKLPLGPEAGETRATFDNVSDYNGLSVSPVSDINGGNSINGYSATVSVSQQQLEASIPLDASLRITVTVTHGNDSLSLSGYRLRYAPRSLP